MARRGRARPLKREFWRLAHHPQNGDSAGTLFEATISGPIEGFEIDSAAMHEWGRRYDKNTFRGCIKQ